MVQSKYLWRLTYFHVKAVIWRVDARSSTLLNSLNISSSHSLAFSTELEAVSSVRLPVKRDKIRWNIATCLRFGFYLCSFIFFSPLAPLQSVLFFRLFCMFHLAIAICVIAGSWSECELEPLVPATHYSLWYCCCVFISFISLSFIYCLLVHACVCCCVVFWFVAFFLVKIRTFSHTQSVRI